MDYLIEALLDKINNEMARLYWNNNQEEINSPFSNTGECYQNDTFTVRAYYWGDDEDIMRLPNFEYKNFKCWWYKHSNRGLYWEYDNIQNNHNIPITFISLMLDECCESLQQDFKNNKRGGLLK